jgi:hypothetical protein
MEIGACLPNLKGRYLIIGNSQVFGGYLILLITSGPGFKTNSESENHWLWLFQTPPRTDSFHERTNSFIGG